MQGTPPPPQDICPKIDYPFTHGWRKEKSELFRVKYRNFN